MPRRKRPSDLEWEDLVYGFDPSDPYYCHIMPRRARELPPPPPKPKMPPDVLKETASRIETENYNAGIFCRDLDEVAACFRAYAGNRPDAAIHTARQKAASNSLAGEFFAMYGPGAADAGSFTEKAIQECRKDLEGSRKRYRGSWDYDGPGPFFKASIDVEPFERPLGEGQTQTGYLFHTYVSYHGHIKDEETAKRLNVPCGLRHIQIQRRFPVERGQTRFAIPIAELMKVWPLFNEPMTPEGLLAGLTDFESIADPMERRREAPTMIKITKGNVGITFEIEHYTIGQYWMYQGKKKEDYELRIENGNLTGPARVLDKSEQYSDSDGVMLAVGVTVRIYPLDSNPSFSEDVRNEMGRLANAVMFGWSPTYTGPNPFHKEEK